ncbi:MAG: MarR family transcriptional regulator [Hyphomicrobiaceae bacterium]|nr:MarR family transcriptional regulator [Hyphomicrobiaceae bacterium]
MADINFLKAPQPRDEAVAVIELLFFAYRDFVSDPDQVLADVGFGRAHHRVLHFVHRAPGMSVAELLDILKITKQSLARVLRQLVDGGYIEQRTGSADRRQRLLFTTDRGKDLIDRLIALQARRIETALEQFSADERRSIRAFLMAVTDESEHAHIADRLLPAQTSAAPGKET